MRMQNGGYAVYNFDTKEPGLGIPDVLLTVKASPASVALYCNPAWVTVEDENNKIAGPLNAIYQSGALQQRVSDQCPPTPLPWSASCSHLVHEDASVIFELRAAMNPRPEDTYRVRRNRRQHRQHLPVGRQPDRAAAVGSHQGHAEL